jgi:hypothetical protein
MGCEWTGMDLPKWKPALENLQDFLGVYTNLAITQIKRAYPTWGRYPYAWSAPHLMLGWCEGCALGFTV